MNRRDALKGVGMALSGTVLMRVRTDWPVSEHEFEPKPDWIRIVVEGGDGAADSTVKVYDRQGNELLWLVQSFNVRYGEQEPRVQLYFLEGDERNSLLLSPEGFLVDYAFEGRVRA